MGKRWTGILAVVAMLMGLLFSAPAQAQIINTDPCNGYEIGWFCWFITQEQPDAVLDCMDCVDLHCDYICRYADVETAMQRYRYCITLGYATCFGDFIVP